MPRQNRVTPLGELVAHPSRGGVFGNRGCLHDADGRIRRHHVGKRWILCRLEFKGRHREVMRAGRYTELFFLDDWTGLAAGHRPCAECRREDFKRYAGSRSATQVDHVLHAERLRPHDYALDDLPDGAMVLHGDDPWLVAGDRLRRWTFDGYTDEVERLPGTQARLITPPSSLPYLRAASPVA